MSKNIVICSDGTGNTAIKDRGTNVFKLFEAVDLNGHRTDPSLTPQIAFYDDGVGTQTFLPLKLLGGAFGWGLKRNVLKLYTELVRSYDPGDRIYLFGFSRGAFTVRTLAGMIARCGVLDWHSVPTTDAMRKKVAEIYSVYRKGYRTALWRLLHGKSDADVVEEANALMAQYKRDNEVHDADIHFIGVWDTVDAVGGPFHTSDIINAVFHRFKFPDHVLNSKIKNAAHALSIDDARAAFEPVLWEQNSNLEQVWFAGVHANVGGGYPKQGMSLVALDWIIRKASEKALRVLLDDQQHFREHANVDDKLYDSRAGLGVFYRWKPRNMKKLWEQQKAGGTPLVHLSVLERIAHGTDGYAPGTLAPQVRVVYTSTGDLAQDQAAAVRAEAVNVALEEAFAARGSDLDKVKGTLLIGRLSYYFYVASCLAVIIAAAIMEEPRASLNPTTILKNAFTLIYDAITGQWAPLVESAKQLVAASELLVALLAAFAISAGLAYFVDHRRSLVFSRFWHDSRHELREALKQARRQVQAAAGGSQR